MGIVLTVLAVVVLLAGVAALGMAARLSAGEEGRPAVIERQRRLRYRLGVPAIALGLLLFVLSRFV